MVYLFQCVVVVDGWYLVGVMWEDCKMLMFECVQCVVVDFQWCDYGDFCGCEFCCEGMFFDDLCFSLVVWVVKFDYYWCVVFYVGLVDVVFVIVECEYVVVWYQFDLC